LSENVRTAKPQVFPSFAASFIKHSRRIGGLHTMGLEKVILQKTLPRRREIKLPPVSLAFCADFRIASIGGLFPVRCSLGAPLDGMMLLIFEAGLISPFRFARTVTILQQVVRTNEACGNVRRSIELN